MILILVLLAVFMLALTLAMLFYRLASRFDAQACNPEWLEGFSLESYAPMERLLDRSDFQFLESQPGYRPEIGQRLLSERRKVFAGYLRLLILDFNQLLRMAKLMLLSCTEDRPEFAKTLWRQQIKFYFAVGMIRCRVALYPLGWTDIDVPRLVNLLGRLRGEVQGLVLPREQDY
jgi:hypothetical protein